MTPLALRKRSASLAAESQLQPQTDMAIEFHKENEGATLALQISGKLVGTDYADFVSEFDCFVAHPGRRCVLLEASGFQGWDGEAIWEDKRFALHRFSQIDQLAIVGGGKWQQKLAHFCKPFSEVLVRYFAQADLAQAKQWLREPQPVV